MVPAGDAKARGSEVPADTPTRVNVGETSVAIESGQFTVAVSAVRFDSQALTAAVEEPLLSDRVIVVARSASIKTVGFGFAPNSPVQIWLSAETAPLARLQTLSNGSFQSIAQLPEGIAFGEYTVRVLVFAPGSQPSDRVEAGESATAELGFGILLLDDTTYEVVRSGSISLDDINRSFVGSIASPKSFGAGQASGWIALFMLMLLFAAYMGEAPLIMSRRRVPTAVNGIIDDSLSMRLLGNRRYALSVAAAALAISNLFQNDFLPVFPTALGFATLMLISAVDPLAGFVAGVTTLVGVFVGGGANSVDEWRAAIVVAASYVFAPMIALAVARRIKRSVAAPVAAVVAVMMYFVVGYSAVRMVGALLRAELSVESSAVWLLGPAAAVLVVRWFVDQGYERQHRRTLQLRRMATTVGLIPAGLIVLGFIVISDVLIDDESLMTLLSLGVIIGIRQMRLARRRAQNSSTFDADR